MIFTIFFSKNENFAKNSNFQGSVEQKLKVLQKKFPGHKICKMIQTFHFWDLEVAKTTSRCFFGPKSIKKKSIFYLWEIYFSSAGLQALEKKNFFLRFSKFKLSAFIRTFKIEKYLQLALLK